MSLSLLGRVLWAASFFGHIALFLVLLLRHRARSFPLFTGLIGFSLLRSPVLFFVSRHGSSYAYFLWYYALAGCDYLLQLAVVWEIARDVLRPTGTWIADARRSFLLWSTIGILVAAALAASMPRADLLGIELWEMRATIFTSLLICETFLAMIFAANRLGLQWRSHVMALGQGLTVWALVAIVGDVANVATGWQGYLPLIGHVRMFVYLAVLFFWCIAFFFPERERAPLSAEMHDYLVALHRQLQYDLESVNHP